MSHPASPIPPSLRPTLARGEGVHVWDLDGHRYLDAISGAFCVQLGYGRSDLVRAMTIAASRLPYARPSVFESEESEAYARELLLAAGSSYTKAVFTSSGSEAVEAAVKAAYRYQKAVGRPERTAVARLRGGFHGATLAALRLTDVGARRAPYEAMLGEGLPPIDAEAIDREIGNAGALIAETIPAAGRGAPVPPPGFLDRMRQACDERGALWIADEVLTGFGRVGALFAWQRLGAGAEPDIVAFGKGAGAGYAALGGILIAGRVAEVLDAAADGPFLHAQTYGGHAIACAVGRRVLTALHGEERIEERVREKEGLLGAALDPLASHPLVREVRGLGFLRGIALVEGKLALRVEAACRERGLLIYAGDDHLLIAPPLVSDPHHFSQIAIGIRESLDNVQSQR